MYALVKCSTKLRFKPPCAAIAMPTAVSLFPPWSMQAKPLGLSSVAGRKRMCVCTIVYSIALSSCLAS